MRRQRTKAPSGELARPVRQPSAPRGDDPALALLADILVGDSAWTVAEVRQLIALRESADGGRWRATGLDDEGPGGAQVA